MEALTPNHFAQSPTAVTLNQNPTCQPRNLLRCHAVDAIFYFPSPINVGVAEGHQTAPALDDIITVQERQSNDRISSDTAGGESTTDPDIETDDTSSDSDSDGYAEGTKTQIAFMKNRWERFCRKQHQKQDTSSDLRWKDPQHALRAAGKREFTKFLYWGLQSIRKIVKAKGLITDEKEKPPLYIEDVIILQETVLRTMEKRFHIGLQRMQQCLYNLMACFTVNRISAMRKLQYKHLQCSIQRDPKGGPPRILLEITYKFAKTHLGVTQGNTFIIPEIIHDPSLMLSPHEFLLGILFDDDAFRAPAIKSRDDLRKLWLEDGRQQLPLPLKAEKANHYVFCKVIATRGVIQIVRDQPISSAALGKQYQTTGEIAGFPNLCTHCNRYGGGTILNQSRLVSDAQQNLIIKHASIRTFLNHYLPRRIGTDMQALMRGLEPDSAMMRAVTRMGRWVDTRRPRELTEAQKAGVEAMPELQEAIHKRDGLARKLKQSGKQSRREVDRHEQLKRNVINTRSRLLYDLRKRVREEFDSSQAVKDIQRQLAAGTAVHDDETRERLVAEENMLPEQIFLLEKLMTWPTSLSLEREWKRRNEAVEAVRMYCRVREGGPRRGRRPKNPTCRDSLSPHSAPTPASTQIPMSYLPREAALRRAEEHIQAAAKPLGCFQCFGNLEESEDRRMKQYSRHKHLLRHFRTTHLDDRHCKYCKMSVEHEDGLRRHAHEKHRLKT
ncbi:hypothetical protein N7532_005531 [Penicillium argentinense]|uniref:C2H2-type domain-containing protein n=1 Tax=Penicillium argentinense TaxID=1131581 RepID=A0A9W9FEC8_9EURO|nr:uncharacterized protein N7532_005531 [Penicillium argentinense]KAJ5098530.1 hypothetical protein N7532_005531 [Penicillium argentinense]